MLGQRIGNYRIVGQIGQGGMGAVYEAVHESVDLRVAVKVLAPQLTADADLLQRFLNEARALSALNHPGVVKLIDFGRLGDGTVYLCLERLYGETLLQRLQRNVGLLPLHDALHLGQRLAAILAAVHHRGLVHRDIKPGNIFLARSPDLGGDEQVKLLDFGLVKLLSGSGLSDNVLQTRVGLLVGTPDYMPPEQCTGAVVGPKADVYSLGVMLYRLVCGDLPFKAADPLALLAAQVQQAPPSLRARMPSVPAALDALVRQMLDKDPARRPTMAQVAERLSAIGAADAADRTVLSGDGMETLTPFLAAARAGDAAGEAPSLLDLEILEVPTTPPAPAPRAARRWGALIRVAAIAGAAGVGTALLLAALWLRLRGAL